MLPFVGQGCDVPHMHLLDPWLPGHNIVCMQVGTSPLRQSPAVEPNEMKHLQKVSYCILHTNTHTHACTIILDVFSLLLSDLTDCPVGGVLSSGHRTPSTSTGLPHSELTHLLLLHVLVSV